MTNGVNWFCMSCGTYHDPRTSWCAPIPELMGDRTIKKHPAIHIELFEDNTFPVGSVLTIHRTGERSWTTTQERAQAHLPG